MQARNKYYYAVCWILDILDKWLWSYQGDKVQIWRKKIKDGRRNPNIFTNFLKNWCSLGINNCLQYVEQQIIWKSGFVDIRVTWMRGGVNARRRRRRNRTKTKSLLLVGEALMTMWCYIIVHNSFHAHKDKENLMLKSANIELVRELVISNIQNKFELKSWANYRVHNKSCMKQIVKNQWSVKVTWLQTDGPNADNSISCHEVWKIHQLTFKWELNQFVVSPLDLVSMEKC